MKSEEEGEEGRYAVGMLLVRDGRIVCRAVTSR